MIATNTGRYIGLKYALQGLRDYHVSLLYHTVSQSHSAITHVSPAGASDDMGLYYFVPKTAYLFNLNIQQAYVIFLSGLIVFALALGFYGCYLLNKKPLAVLITTAVLLPLGVLLYQTGDVYIAPAVTVIAIIPLFYYFIKQHEISKGAILFYVFAGMFLVSMQMIRSFSAIPVLSSMFFITLFIPKLSKLNKLIIIACVSLGLLLSTAGFSMLVHKRDRFLSKHTPNYQAVVTHHPLWHAIYAGLGYLKNPYGLRWDDTVVAQKVYSIKKDAPYVSAEYEAILKQVVFDFVKKHPGFVLKTIYAKSKAILKFDKTTKFYLWALLFLILIFPKGWVEELGLAGGLFTALLPGIIVYPASPYFTSFTAFVAIYFIISICHALRIGIIKRVLIFTPRPFANKISSVRIEIPESIKLLFYGVLASIVVYIFFINYQALQTIISSENRTLRIFNKAWLNQDPYIKSLKNSSFNLNTLIWRRWDHRHRNYFEVKQGKLYLQTALTKSSYEITVTIPTLGAEFLYIPFTLRVQAGQGFIGILNQTKSKWLVYKGHFKNKRPVQDSILVNTENQRAITVVIGADNINPERTALVLDKFKIQYYWPSAR